MTIENNNQKPVNSRFTQVKHFMAIFDNLQGRILALAMTVSVLLGIINHSAAKDEPTKDESTKPTVVLEVELKTGGKDKRAVEQIPHHDNSEQNIKDKDSATVQHPIVEKTETNPLEAQPKPENVRVSTEKSVPQKDSKYSNKTKTASKQAKPADPAVKPMTAEEHKKLEEEMNKVKKELDERRKAEDPDDKLSNVKEDERKKINEDEENFRKKMEKVFNNQSE